MQGRDAFFDRAFGDESIDGHGAKLSHAVGAVGGLVFDSRIPPRIHVQHVIGRCQVQAEASGFQADQEDVTFGQQPLVEITRDQRNPSIPRRHRCESMRDQSAASA